jgi:arsenate reductase-like glutaredoxin family protein
MEKVTNGYVTRIEFDELKTVIKQLKIRIRSLERTQEELIRILNEICGEELPEELRKLL